VSALAARRRLRSRFALLMGDHLFAAGALRQLLLARVEPDESLLAVDSRPPAPEIAAEATKVRRRGSHIVAIGKALTDYDALDTGLFVCTPSLFPALESARAQGDTTLSGGIRLLAARGRMRWVDIGAAAWFDIDTIDDLQSAEALLDGRVGAGVAMGACERI
jgi:choline kinase